MLWLMNNYSSCVCCGVCCVPVSLQSRLLVPLRVGRTLPGAPATVNSQKMRTRSGDRSELLLGNRSLGDRGRTQHLFSPALPVTPVTQVNGNMKVERWNRIHVVVFLLVCLFF